MISATITVHKDGGDLVFTPHDAYSIEYVQSTSFDGNDVQSDEIAATVRQDAADWLSNWSGVNRKSPVRISYRSRQEKYCFKNIRRVAKRDFELTAQSPLGRLTDDFQGNLYRNAPLPDVIAAVIGGAIPAGEYSVNPLLASVRVYGWIPYQERRMSLHQLAVAYGFIIRRDENHNLYFTVPDTEPYDIPDSAIFTGGSVDYSVGATYARADITAYDYLPRDAEAQILFDNTDAPPADNLIVRFDSPMFDVRAEGALTILDSGVNYATVSGVGRLAGKPYAQIASVVSVEGDPDADPQHILSVSNIPMITSLSAASVGERLLNYHNAPAVVSMDILRTNQRSGDCVSFNDPFGDPQTGYIAALDGSITSIDRATASIVCGYEPIWGSAYDDVEVLEGSGSWTVPDFLDGKRIRVVLIGGGTGGASGQHGTDSGGKGGIGGTPGVGGKVLDVIIPASEVTAGDVYAYQCGTGGAGGVPSGETSDNLDDDSKVYESGGLYHLRAHGEGVFSATTLAKAVEKHLERCGVCFQASDSYYVNNPGSPGTASSFGGYSSDGGSRSNVGFYDMLEGKLYAASGADNGVDGGQATAAAENGDRENPAYNDIQRFTVSPPWDASRSWQSGNVGVGATKKHTDGLIEWGYGGLGGGAAVGANGGDGLDVANPQIAYQGGPGGRGADAQALFPPDTRAYGSGGSGGHGGGEGGMGGSGNSSDPEATGTDGIRPGEQGRGGSGSAGQDGADGCILIYFHS